MLRIGSCPCRIPARCTMRVFLDPRYALGLARRRCRTLDTFRSVHRHRSRYMISNLNSYSDLSNVTFLTVVRTRALLGWFCYTFANQGILYHKVMDMSSFSACVLAGIVTFVCYVFRGNVVKCYE